MLSEGKNDNSIENKLMMHSTAVRLCPPKKRVFIVFAHRLIDITLLTLVQATL